MIHSFRTGNVKSLMPLTKCPQRLGFPALLTLCLLWQGGLRAEPPEASPAAAPSPESTPPPLEPPPSNVIISPASGAPKPDATPPVTEKATAKPDTGGGPRFVGSQGCSSSMCHGGGSPVDGRNAYTIWKKLDHHARAFVTLSGERSARMAQALQLPSPKETRRCTECHSPFQTVPESRMMASAKPDDGISCETCHGAAENWIRSHTRRDFTHAQNVQTGVRDIRGLYGRANTCVSCHQVLPPDILQAGHPPLIFELDAQMIAEPKHWKDEGDYVGPKAWLVGQAAALRETSWSLSQQAEPVPEVREQWRALVWLLQKTADAYGGNLPKFDVANATDFSAGNVTRAQTVADDLARAAAGLDWTRSSTRRCLEALAATHKEFVPAVGGESATTQQHRAQRLVLALSRLLAPFQAKDMTAWKAASVELDKLFKVADARMAFDSGAFATQLQKFQTALSQDGSSNEAKVAGR
jgi:hypothetical protein